jgi:adenine-specific DNA methylase
MHKWWARRPGCLFRAISLYTLLDENMDIEDFEIYEPGQNQTLGGSGNSREDLVQKIQEVDMDNPESLWDLYPKDIRVNDLKVLDPFMGGGTSLVEASRFGVESEGWDLNPVAWFVTKKQMEAGSTEIEELEEAFEQVKSDVKDEIFQYYLTQCPHGDHKADVMYNFWVKELDCTSCGNTVPLFKDYRIAKGRYENDDKDNVLCPNCESVILVDDWREECSCSECDHEFIPQEGTVDYGDYICSDCGQRYSITGQIQDGDEFNLRLFAVEYYCTHCAGKEASRSQTKGYKIATSQDKDKFRNAKEEWRSADELRQYVPDKPIRPGWKTDANHFEGTMPGNGNLPRHGINKWIDMFNERQLLCLSKLLKSISEVENSNAKEYLLLAFSESLRCNSQIVGYQASNGHISDLWRTNSFEPPTSPAENNLWGTEYGMITFRKTWEMVLRGVEYANAPTERYVENEDTHETDEFSQPIGQNSVVKQGDMRLIDAEDEYDAVITDPPYYNNILYSELSDFHYV